MTTIIRADGGQGMPLLVHGASGASAVISISPSKKSKLETHTSAKPSATEEEGKTWHIPWGTTNDFPRDIAKMVQKSTVARAGLQRLVKYLYGQRLITFTLDSLSGSGKEEITLVKNQDWLDILSRSNIKAFRLTTKQDYTWFAIGFAEFIFTEDKSKVWSFNFHKASHCRFAPIDPRTGYIPHVFVSGNFPDAKEADCQKLPVIDMVNFYDQIETIKTDKSRHKYIFPMFWPDVVNDYYPVAAWDSARTSGWLDIAISIPAYKKALFKNQMSLKYDIQIPIEYFEFKYKNWAGKTQAQQDEILQGLYDSVTASLTGAANAQKALMSFYKTDSRSGKPIGQWQINVIDDKMKNDAYLPDTTAADFQISYAMGLNPAQSGQGTTAGTNKGGSDIRESGLELRGQLKADRDICLSFFDFIKAYNGLPQDLELGVQDVVLTTLDQGKGTEKVVS